MDCSNPVIDSTRASVSSILGNLAQLRRQDLQYLQVLGDSGRRALVSTPDADQPLVKATIGRIQVPELGPSNIEEKDIPCPKVLESIPIASIKRDDGSEIRSSAHNVSKGKVNINRYFAQGKPATHLVAGLVRHFTADEVTSAMNSQIYTSGTVEGFIKRLTLMTSRKCVSIHTDPTKVVPASLATLRKYMPCGSLPSWHADDLMDLIAQVETSKQASAGAPYWRAKGECLPDVLEYGLPKFVEAMKDGVKAFSKFQRENPEFFILECKNKTDRYDVAKLGDKTRPYFNTPAHISLLQSTLMQPFCRALKLFTEDANSRNAYGYTLAHGGGRKLWERIQNLQKNGDYFFIVYGDDVDLYIRIKDKIYRVAPDFKQMDYSVDYDTLELTLNYLQDEFQRQHGDNKFWRTFIHMWKELLRHPHIMVQGTGVYTKNPDGLMSGVVGTTLFDTVKSVLAYERYVADLKAKGLNQLFEEVRARAFFTTQGLDIKAGTWVPEVVDMNLEPGRFQGNRFIPGKLPSENKFLGVQTMPVEGPSGVDFVPYLPREDWLKVLATPRDDPGQRSTTDKRRTHFDRMRGYLVTGAIFDAAVQEYCYAEIDRTPSNVILMQTQGSGTGEIEQIVGEEFAFPTSECVPSAKWVFDIYASEGNTFGEAPLDVFEEHIIEQVHQIRRVDRRIKVEMKFDSDRNLDLVVPAPLIQVETTGDPLDATTFSITGRVQDLPPPPELGLPDMTTFEPLSLTDQVSPEAHKDLIRFGSQAAEWVGHGVAPVRGLAEALSLTESKAIKLLKREGFYVRKFYGEMSFSQYPFIFEGEAKPNEELELLEKEAITEGLPKVLTISKPKMVALPCQVEYEAPLPGPPVTAQLAETPSTAAMQIVHKLRNSLGKERTEFKIEDIHLGDGSEKRSHARMFLQFGFEQTGPLIIVSGPSRSACKEKLYARLLDMNAAKIALAGTAVVKTQPALGYVNGHKMTTLTPKAPIVGSQPYVTQWADEVVNVPVKAPSRLRVRVRLGETEHEVEMEEDSEGVMTIREDGKGAITRALMEGVGAKIPPKLSNTIRKTINRENDRYRKKDLKRVSRYREAEAKTPAREEEAAKYGRPNIQSNPACPWWLDKKRDYLWQRPAPSNSKRKGQEGSAGSDSSDSGIAAPARKAGRRVSKN